MGFGVSSAKLGGAALSRTVCESPNFLQMTVQRQRCLATAVGGQAEALQH